MGAVYLARHTTLGVDVALKILPADIAKKSPDYANRFLREARVAAALRHPNVVGIMDADQDPATGLFYMVEEYVDGGSLRERLQARGAFSEKEAIAATVGILKALQAAYKQGIVHRDIKPDNILVTKDGKVKLGDLGLAKKTDSSEAGLTHTSATMGTPHYMSPEQIEDTSKVDIRGDIYSLGASFYHFLALAPPYAGNEVYAVLHKVMTAPIPDVRTIRPDVTEGTARIIMKMLAKNADERYQTPADVLADLVKGGPALELMPDTPRGSPAIAAPGTPGSAPIPSSPGAATPGQMFPSPGSIDLTTPLPGTVNATQKAVYVIAGCCVLLLLFAVRMMMKSSEPIADPPKKVAATEDPKPADPPVTTPDPKVPPVKPVDPPVKPTDPPVKPADPPVKPPEKPFTLHNGCLMGFTFEPETESETEASGGQHRGWQDPATQRYIAISIQVVTGEGRVGKGAGFNGTSSYLSLPPVGQRTVAAWLKPLRAKSMVWFDGGQSGKHKGFLAGLMHPEREGAGRGDGAFLSFGEMGVMAAAPTVFEGWHHLAVVWDGDRSVRIAVDGALVEGFVLTSDPGRPGPRPGARPEPRQPPFALPEKPSPEGDAITIGRPKTTGPLLPGFFAGAIDELAAWDRALTDDELKQLPAFAADGKSYVEAIGERNAGK